MIYLKKGQIMLENSAMVVCDPTGYYDDNTSVVCAPVFAPEEPCCRYEAKYIAYGGIVYAVSDPDELLKQITEMDPNTLFGKDSKQVSVDTAINTIVPQEVSNIDNNTPSKETSVSNEPTVNPPAEILPPVDTVTKASSTEAVASSSTPPVDVSTTTPPIIPPAETLVSTSTVSAPSIETSTSSTPPAVDTSTTTASTTTPVEAPPASPIEMIADVVSSLVK